MNPSRVWLVLAACLFACSSRHGTQLRVGHEPKNGGQDGGAAGAIGSGNGGQSAVGSEGNALSVHVEDIQKMTLDVVTIACAGDCVQVEAVARGGHAPYAFRWADGSTAATRQLCPDASVTFSVTVTDTAIRADEFHYDSHSASATVDAKVLDCPDGGIATTGACDRATDHFVAASPSQNPSDAWSYGYTSTLGGTLVPFSTFAPAMAAAAGAVMGNTYPDIAQWYDSSLGAVPDVMYNGAAAAVHPAHINFGGNAFTVQPGQLSLEPGTQNQYAVARWTAPSAGTYVVRGAFEGLCGDNGLPKSTTDVHVQHNGVDVGAAQLNLMGGGNTAAITKAIALAAGDSMDFVVGSGNGSYIYDFTALDAELCSMVARDAG